MEPAIGFEPMTPAFTSGAQSATFGYLCDKTICEKSALTSLTATFQNTGCYTSVTVFGIILECFWNNSRERIYKQCNYTLGR